MQSRGLARLRLEQRASARLCSSRFPLLATIQARLAPMAQGWPPWHKAGPIAAPLLHLAASRHSAPLWQSYALYEVLSKMSGTCLPGECASLQSITSFTAYVGCMRNVTSQDLTVSAMTKCRQPICSALYGIGNADISGIGVSPPTNLDGPL
jgi:hypothetical protein